MSSKPSMAYDDSRIFQQYFSYIVVVNFIVEEIRILGENHRPIAIHQQTLSHNVISSTPRQLLGGDSHILHMGVKGFDI